MNEIIKTGDWNETIQGLSNLGTDVSESDGRRYLVTSHSIDGTFESCPRRFEFRHVLGQLPDVDETGFAAEAGTALHEALQQYTRSWNEQEAYLTLMRWWPWAMEAAQERKQVRSFDQATLLLRALMEHEFWQEWEPAVLPDGTKAIELAYRINHTSLGSFIHPQTKKRTFIADQGKMDWIVQHRVTKELMVVDLKTTTYEEDLHDAAFRFSGQGGGYGMVLSTAVGHDFHKHGLKVCYFLAEFSAYGPSVRPHIYNLGPTEVEDLIIAKRERLSRMLRYAQSAYWPRRTHGCTFYKSKCAYLDVCERRDLPFLLDWFKAEDQRFRFKERIYEPYWTLEA